MSYTNDILDYYGIQKKNDDELMHYAKGQTKKGAKYLRRLFKKGKWIYEYPITGKGYKRTADNLNPLKWESKALGYERSASNEAYRMDGPRPLSIKYSRAAERARRMSESEAVEAAAKYYREKYANESLGGFLENILDDVSFDVRHFIQQHRRKKVVNWP